MAYDKINQIPMGLPVTEARAQELATVIAEGLSDGAPVDALVELLLGIGPLYTNHKDFPEVDLQNFIVDLECRRLAAQYALAVLFETSEAFLDAFSRYVQEHAPKQTMRSMIDVLGFDVEIATPLLTKHLPIEEKTAPAKGKRTSEQGRGKR